jgi:sec-independent protein translocase protein TatB
MLSIGWTEMMVIAAIALIVVGPRDLPGMLRQVGRAVGSVRRMGNEFKAELNKVAAVDEIRDIRKSIASPLTETRRSIESDFNKLTKDGGVEPTGRFKPTDPKNESVYEEIRKTVAKPEGGAVATAANKTPAAAVKPARRTTGKPVAKSAAAKSASNSKTARATSAKAPAGTAAKAGEPATRTPDAASKTTARPTAGAKPASKANAKPAGKSAASRPLASKPATAKPADAKSATAPRTAARKRTPAASARAPAIKAE